MWVVQSACKWTFKVEVVNGAPAVGLPLDGETSLQ